MDRPWRSIDDLTPGGPPPAGPERPDDGAPALTRRTFFRVAAASTAVTAACLRDPVEALVVPAVEPEGHVPGRATYYATSLVRDGYARGVLVACTGGRPTKVEGNPLHPSSLGATDAIDQAQIPALYDPQRSQAVRRQGIVATWDALRRLLRELVPPDGRGLRVLTGRVTSPTVLRLLARLREERPEARWHAWQPVGDDRAREGERIARGRALDRVLRLDRADVVVALDADPLTGRGSVRNAYDLMSRRRVRVGAATMSRLYAAEPTPTLFGAVADHRIPLSAGRVRALARALAVRLGVLPAGLAEPLAPEEERFAAAVAADLQAHRSRGVVLVGEPQPPAIHALAAAIDEALQSGAVTPVAPVAPVEGAPDGPAGLPELARDLAAGRVQVLLLLDVNPAYDAPADLDMGALLPLAPLSVHVGLTQDETARAATWHVPLTHDLEAWGDARGHDGTASLIQPAIAPLWQSASVLQVLATVLGDTLTPAMEQVQQTWRGHADPYAPWWHDTLRRGVVEGTAAPPVEAPVDRARVAAAVAALPPEERGTTLELRPDPTIWDGRHAPNAWLQELPKPLTTLTWDNAALLSPALAAELGIESGRVVELSAAGALVLAPAWVHPGQARDSVTLTLGYGRRFGVLRGADAYPLRTTERPWTVPVRIRATDARTPLAPTQQHGRLEGRHHLRHGTLGTFRESPAEVAAPHHRGGPSFFPVREPTGTQWGMSIDLGACIGCGACVLACEVENNIPIVGKEQVIAGREMAWIRIDRYFEGPADDPSIHHQPVPCMHCETAPCEVVCPVAATLHSHDGLNEMIYNRCVGTRFCSNNCPYKVRRFNFLQYADEGSATRALGRNPEVTVRQRGVMEKCTYCVQRIRTATIQARREDRTLADGEVLTACQQVCPTQAIVFGDKGDAQTHVSREKAEPHSYGMLEELNTRPRTTYLAAVRNPSPALADPEDER